jgi:DNA-directed RNA polymerase specialized sigma24 family protein
LLSAVETREILHLVLEEEDEGTQAAIVYHFVDGMTHDEAGEILGVSGAAIRKRIAQFRARLASGRLAFLREAG